MRAGSAPVGVGPAWPTDVGNNEGNALVGLEGGKRWTSVEPASGLANWAREEGSCCMFTKKEGME